LKRTNKSGNESEAVGKKKKNKKRKILVLLIIFFLIGMCVFLYPVFTRFFISNNTEKNVDDFNSEIDRIISEAVENGEIDNNKSETEKPYLKLLETEEPPEHQPYLDNLYQYMRNRNLELFETRQSELNGVYSYQYPEIAIKYYGIKTPSIGTLEIDKLNLNLSIFLGANDANLASGSGHLTNTSYYLGGKNTNCVIAVHRGLGGADFLRYVNRLENGDIVRVRNFWYTLEYKVTDVKITEPDDVDSIHIQSGRDMLALYTCHPYGINTQRYIVYCERVTE